MYQYPPCGNGNLQFQIFGCDILNESIHTYRLTYKTHTQIGEYLAQNHLNPESTFLVYIINTRSPTVFLCILCILI